MARRTPTNEALQNASKRSHASVRRVTSTRAARRRSRSDRARAAMGAARRFAPVRACLAACVAAMCAVALVSVARSRGRDGLAFDVRASSANASSADGDVERAASAVVVDVVDVVVDAAPPPTNDTGTGASRAAPTRALFDATTTTTGRFFDAFFEGRLDDAAEFDGAVVSRATLIALAARAHPKLSVYRLSREHGGASTWTHVSGPGTFWSTNDFHAFVRTHVNGISEGLPHDFREAYFLINNFDEPQAVSERCVADLSRLRQLHANVVDGAISPAENVPVWSMSKIRGCHRDILFPFPDYFARLREKSAEPRTCASPWRNRAGDIAFRGSTTGFGDAQTNLRARTLEQLINEPGFDVGFTDAGQGFKQSWAPHLFRQKMSGEDFCKYKAIMDIDGNAHSFNRQLLIAEAGAVMVRVNVFTDWFADGVMGDEFCYDVDPSDVLNASRMVRASLNNEPARAEEIAQAYSRLAKWVVQDDIAIRYLREAFSRYIAAVRFVE